MKAVLNVLMINDDHCMLFRPKNGKAITFGMCIPAVCSMDFLQKLLKIDDLVDGMVSIELAENTCQLEEQITKLKTIDWYTM